MAPRVLTWIPKNSRYALHRLQPMRDRVSEDCIDVLAMDVELWLRQARKEKCWTSLSSTPRVACFARSARKHVRRRV